MDARTRKKLDELLTEWNSAIHDRQYNRKSDSALVSSRWQGEIKAYEVAIFDLEMLIREAKPNFDFTAETLIYVWQHEPGDRLGYANDQADETPGERAEREAAVDTLSLCADQLSGCIEGTPPDDE